MISADEQERIRLAFKAMDTFPDDKIDETIETLKSFYAAMEKYNVSPVCNTHDVLMVLIGQCCALPLAAVMSGKIPEYMGMIANLHHMIGHPARVHVPNLPVGNN